MRVSKSLEEFSNFDESKRERWASFLVRKVSPVCAPLSSKKRTCSGATREMEAVELRFMAAGVWGSRGGTERARAGAERGGEVEKKKEKSGNWKEASKKFLFPLSLEPLDHALTPPFPLFLARAFSRPHFFFFFFF